MEAHEYYYTERKSKNWKWGRPGNKANTKSLNVSVDASSATHTHHTPTHTHIHTYTAAYNTDKIHPYREPHAPAYSFGKRLDSTHSRCPTPSPNAYTLPTLVGSAIVGKKSYPAYSIQGRAKLGGFDEDLRKVYLLHGC